MIKFNYHPLHHFADKTISGNDACIISVDEFSCFIYVVMLKSKSMFYLNSAFTENKFKPTVSLILELVQPTSMR